MLCSIFIASSTSNAEPASTCWPGDTSTRTTLPFIGAVSPPDTRSWALASVSGSYRRTACSSPIEHLAPADCQGRRLGRLAGAEIQHALFTIALQMQPCRRRQAQTQAVAALPGRAGVIVPPDGRQG